MTPTTMTLIALALAAAVAALTVSPLLRRSANRPLGRGREDDSPIRRWQEEKDRLTAQLRDNDIALAEGRLDEATHAAIAARLAAEADHALSRLREAREGLTPVAAEAARPVRAWRAAAGAALVVAAAYGAHAFASRGDVDMTAHAGGEAAVAGTGGQAAVAGTSGQAAAVGTDGGGVPVGADGMPDIGAMVARLEARIEGGDYTPEDAAMLLRSYRALGREDDARALLAKAAAAFPDDVRLKLTFVETALSGTDAAMLAEAQAMVAGLLEARPDLPEARWYRSLFLVRQGDLDGARAELRALQPLVAANKEAADAVAGLLARLDVPAHDQLQPK